MVIIINTVAWHDCCSQERGFTRILFTLLYVQISHHHASKNSLRSSSLFELLFRPLRLCRVSSAQTAAISKRDAEAHSYAKCNGYAYAYSVSDTETQPDPAAGIVYLTPGYLLSPLDGCADYLKTEVLDKFRRSGRAPSRHHWQGRACGWGLRLEPTRYRLRPSPGPWQEMDGRRHLGNELPAMGL